MELRSEDSNFNKKIGCRLLADAGRRVGKRGLCSFYVKEYESYTGRNPKTGDMVTVKAKKLPFSRPGRSCGGWMDEVAKNGSFRAPKK